MPAADERRIHGVVEPLVTAAGFDLEALTVQTAGRRRVVKVIVDSDDGVDLDRAAAVSRAISAALDDDDAAVGSAAYVLEVTSPGVGRPLTEPRHFRRSRRRLLVVTTGDGRTVTGHLLRVVEPGTAEEAPDAGITLLVGPRADETRLRWDEVDRARVEVEFSAPPAPVRERLDAELGPVESADPAELDDDDHDGPDLEDEDEDDGDADDLEGADFEGADEDDTTADAVAAEDEGAHR